MVSFEIHDENGCLYTGEESEILSTWCFLTVPGFADNLDPDTQSKMKRTIVKKSSGVLKLVRVLKRYDPADTNTGKNEPSKKS